MVSSAANTDTDILTHVRTCCQALYDKKAEDITVLDLGGISSIADYFVIATGTSDPHLRALAGAAESSLKDEGVRVLGRDRTPGTGWMVVDAHDIIVHMFTPETRRHYNLEGLWKDADPVEIELV
jgi:ribosome-associated protein